MAENPSEKVAENPSEKMAENPSENSRDWKITSPRAQHAGRPAGQVRSWPQAESFLGQLV